MNGADLPRSAVPSNSLALTRQPIGEILVSTGVLSRGQIPLVLQHQAEQGVLFGIAATQLGFATQEQVHSALSMQRRFPVTALDPVRSRELVMTSPQHARTAESLRALRTELMLRWLTPAQAKGTSRCLAITGVERGSGRTFIAANLAAAFAQARVRTLLVDLDLRNPRIGALFGFHETEGLADCLAGTRTNVAVHTPRDLPSLYVMPAGRPSPDAQELLSTSGLPELLSAASACFDLVILDTSADECGADAQLVAARAGCAVLVNSASQGELHASSQFLSRLTAGGVNVVGAVANLY